MMKERNQAIEDLKCCAAFYLVIMQAADIANRQLERTARRARYSHQRETKMHIGNLERLTAGIKKEMEWFTEWGMTMTQFENHAKAFDALLGDGSDVATLIAHMMNAEYNSDNAKLFIESYCKSLTKQALIRQELINQMKAII